ncbi:MAG: hypothetical protein LUE11_07130 [Clostridia bacterium]|nr:hypothetical protein [Clostridia bacterium]
MALNFCPFETEPGHPDQFKKIKFNKEDDLRYVLGYELRFILPHAWDELNEKLTDSQDLQKKYVQIAEDSKLKDKYYDNTEHYLIVGINEEGQLRQKAFWDLVEKHGKILDGEIIEEESQNKIANRTEEKDSGYENAAQPDHSRFIPTNKGGRYYLRCADQGDGTYRFWLQTKDGEYTSDFMYALPCCPHCHHVLPKGWLDPQYTKFMSVGMLGDSETGKTTMLYSMIADDFEAFMDYDDDNPLPWDFSHTTRKDEEPLYDRIVEATKEMCRDNGICPRRTEKDHWIEPLFIEVGHTESENRFILGIYDASGENQDYGQGQHTQQIHGCFDAIINLLQPETLSCYCAPESEKTQVDTEILENHLKSIAEQGEMQRNAGKSRMRMCDLVQPVKRQKSDVEMMTKPFNFLNRYLLQYDTAARKQHVSFTIVKCDKLRKGLDHANIDEEIRNFIPMEPISLSEGFLDEDARKLRQSAFKQLMMDYMVKGKVLIKKYNQKFKSCSYHCVSALGCDTVEISEGRTQLVGEYNPICITEPLLACVEKWYAEQKWGMTDEI